MGKRLLVVDDEAVLLKSLKFNLEQEGYEIDTAVDGLVASKKAIENDYDLIILDLMLPEKNGFEVCGDIRKHSNVPIIILTAKGEDESKILGLNYGADDYLTKPFNTLELKARIKAIFRRVDADKEQNKPSNIYKYGDLEINTLGRKVVIGEKSVNLTAKEFDLLMLLVMNANTVFAREDLLEKIWGYEYYGDVRTVDVHIRRLREKIEKNSSKPEYILTKWGVGYYFNKKE